MANQSNLSDDTYGIQSPDDLLAQQAKAYEQAQQNARTPTDRFVGAGLYGIQNMFGGGPDVNKARLVQARMQDIMQQVNANSDPNEDPLTKQLRMSQAISQGMAGTDITVALRAQDQSVRLAQAAKQQQVLDLTMQENRQKLSDEQYRSQIERNTPHQMLLVKDLGKDKDQLSLGYEAVNSYDLTDASSLSKMQAAIKAAQENGQTLQTLTPEQLATSKYQVAAANGQARAFAAMQAAAARNYATDNKQPGSSAINDRYNNYIMSASDMAIGSVESISRMPFGTSRGMFVDGQFAHPGESLYSLTGQNIRNALTNSDAQLYNTFIAGLGNNLAAIEMQGRAQGMQGLAARLQDKIQIKPGDHPLAVMGKLAEMRDSIDRGLAITMADSHLDPAKRDEMQQMLGRLHQSIPFTRNDVVAFSRAQDENPAMSFQTWAKTNQLAGAETKTVYPTPPITDDRGNAAVRQY